jgi:hypothetical protein
VIDVATFASSDAAVLQAELRERFDELSPDPIWSMTSRIPLFPTLVSTASNCNEVVSLLQSFSKSLARAWSTATKRPRVPTCAFEAV